MALELEASETEPKERAKPDPELAAIQKIIRILDGLSEDQLDRVTTYLSMRYTVPEHQAQLPLRLGDG